MVSPSISRTLRWLAGMEDDDQAEPPQWSGPGYNDPTAGGTISTPIPGGQDLSPPSPPQPSLYERGQQVLSDAFPAAQPRPPGPSTTGSMDALGSAIGTIGDVGQAVGRGISAVPEGLRSAGEAIDPYLTGPARTAPTWEDPLAPVREVASAVTDPSSRYFAPVVAPRAYLETSNAFSEPIAEAATEGMSETPFARGTIPEAVPFVGGSEVTLPSPRDVGQYAVQGALDPLSYAGVPGAARAGHLGRGLLEAVPLVGEGLGVAQLGAAAGRRLGAAGRGIGEALAGNAERVAAADARMAAEGSTLAPGTLGAVPGGSNLEARIAAAEARLEHAATRLESADAMLAQAADAGSPAELRAARSTYSPARSAYDEAAARVEQLREQRRMVSRDIEGAGYGRPVEDAGIDTSAVQREATSAYPGQPESVPPFRDDAPRSISLNAGLGTVPDPDRLAGVNRVLGQGIASSVSGGVGAQINEQMNPDDPYAGLKGFAAGALVPPLAARGGMALARRAGRSTELGSAARIGLGDVPPSQIRRPLLPGMETGAPAPIGEAADALRLGPEQRAGASPVVQKVLSAAEERARKMAERGEEPLSPLRWTAEALRNTTYSSLIGPATAVGNVIANVSEPLRALPKELVRAVGRGEPREFSRMFTEGLYGLMGSKGEIVDAIKARGRYAANPDQPSLAERTINPVGHRIAAATEVGGRFFSGLPDAPFQALALRAGRGREASQVATDLGLKGGDWDAYVDRLLADVKAVQGGELPTLPETQRVIDAGESYANRQTFRDELGTIGKKVEAASLHKVPVLGPLVSPFFKTPWNIAVRTAERTPAGWKMNSQASRFDRHYDAVEGSAFLAAMILGPAAAGAITGSGPTDPEKRKMLQAEGWQPYSTYVPGAGVYVPNRYFGTYGTLLNLIGDGHDTLAYAKRDEGINGWLAEAAPKIGKNLRQQQYLTPLAEILDMLDAPSPGAAIARYAGQTAAKAVPYAATARTVATALDPSQRQLEGGAQTSFGERAGQAFEQQVGARSALPVAQDVLGRPVENPQQGLGAFGPRMTRPSPDPIVGAFRGVGVDLTGPPSSVDGVDFTPAQQRAYQETLGRELARIAGPTIAGPNWETMPLSVRKQLLETLRETARTLAESRVRAEGGADFARRSSEATVKKALGR